MLFLPYSTDAPVYHWPYATVGLIAVNVLLSAAIAPDAVIDPTGPWFLSYGAGLRPDQWVGSLFAHAGAGHLVSNMLFLWVFGLVVEGKLGPPRFLACYFGIGVTQSAIEQILMLGSTDGGGSLGASSAVYGLLAMAAIWAPVNTINFFYWVLFYFGTYEVTLLGLATFYIGIDLTFALLAMSVGAGVTSSLLHVMGALLGGPLAVVLLRRNLVDCEGWDFLTRYGGAPTPAEKEEKEHQARLAERAEKTAERDRVTLTEAVEHFDRYLAEGKPAAALQLYTKLRHRGDGWRLEVERLRALVQGLHAEKRWGEAAPMMAELIEADPENAPALRVALAQLCVTRFERPGRALELLAAADVTVLPPKQRQKVAAIAARAAAMQEEGVVEIDDEAW